MKSITYLVFAQLIISCGTQIGPYQNSPPTPPPPNVVFETISYRLLHIIETDVGNKGLLSVQEFSALKNVSSLVQLEVSSLQEGLLKIVQKHPFPIVRIDWHFSYFAQMSIRECIISVFHTLLKIAEHDNHSEISNNLYLTENQLDQFSFIVNGYIE